MPFDGAFVVGIDRQHAIEKRHQLFRIIADRREPHPRVLGCRIEGNDLCQELAGSIAVTGLRGKNAAFEESVGVLVAVEFIAGDAVDNRGSGGAFKI